MKENYLYCADMHTHTVASGHARNTINEMAKSAADRGISLLGITEHSVTMPGTCQEIYFKNLKDIDRNVNQVELCLGVELNIMDFEGNVDMNESLLREMDVAIASIHNTIGYNAGTLEQNTNAIIGAMKNPYINIIGHPDDSNILLDYERLVDASKKYNTLLEINNNSLTPGNFRKEPEKNDIRILELCKAMEVPVIIGSDAHDCNKVGNHEYAMKLVEQVGFPLELILNFSKDKLKGYLNKYRK